jgi:hypothetical protein
VLFSFLIIKILFLQNAPKVLKIAYERTYNEETNKMKDNGGRRLIIDRRKCTNFDHFPERRTLRFRRSDFDRRKASAENSRIAIERRASFR